jgi:hypothetical protein
MSSRVSILSMSMLFFSISHSLSLANSHRICRTAPNPISKKPMSDADCDMPTSINSEQRDVKRNSTPAAISIVAGLDAMNSNISSILLGMV